MLDKIMKLGKMYRFTSTSSYMLIYGKRPDLSFEAFVVNEINHNDIIVILDIINDIDEILVLKVLTESGIIGWITCHVEYNNFQEVKY